MKQLTGRDAMGSLGASSHRAEVQRQFWVQIATGITREKAAEVVGVSQAVGSRWLRHRAGMPLFMSKPVSRKYLSFAQGEEIGLLRAQDVGAREIAPRIGRSPSTVSRELTRSPWQRGTNENTNGLLRQYFPKGTDLSWLSEREIQAVALTLNNRPRKTLGWKTPAQALNKHLKPAA